MTTRSRILSGTIVNVYAGDVGATATTIGAADGAISPSSADWTLIAQGKYQDGVVFNRQDERTQLVFQGSDGIPSEERRTAQGLMVTLQVFDHTPELVTYTSGTSVSETAAASGQVGIRSQNLDMPLAVPEYGCELVIDSPYDEDGDEGWKGLVYIPKVTFHLGPANWATSVEPIELMIRQLRHTSSATHSFVFADATA